MSVSIVAEGLADIADYIERLPDLATEAAVMAINQVARDEEVDIRREMGKQINFPKAYLKANMGVARKANRNLLQAVIRGRDRPTSLARFAEGATRQNTKGRPIIVKVKAGQSKTLNRAFLVELRNGNTGLAIRLPKGQSPDFAYRPVPLTTKGGQQTGTWLLYGPSVDQVMRGVADDRAPQVADQLSREFFRQFTRLSRRG